MGEYFPPDFTFVSFKHDQPTYGSFPRDSPYNHGNYSNSFTGSSPYSNSFCVCNSPYNNGFFFLLATVLIAVVFVCNSHNNSSVAPGRPDHQSDQKKINTPPYDDHQNRPAPGQCSYKSPNRETSSDMSAL